MLRIKSKLKVITKEGYTYRKLLGELKSGKVVSIPELLQRILPKDVWDNAVKNSYMDEIGWKDRSCKSCPDKNLLIQKSLIIIKLNIHFSQKNFQETTN